MKKIFAVILLIISTSVYPQNQTDQIRITSSSAIKPVFIEDNKNVITEISITTPPGMKTNVNEILIQTENSSSSKIIKAVNVYLVKKAEDSLLCSINKIAKNKIAANFNYSLSPGISKIKIAVEIRPNSSLDSFLNIKCAYIKIGNDKFPIESQFQNLRIGHIVRKPWDDYSVCYRIPGLVTTNKGTLIAVYDIRKKSCRDLPGDIDIGMSRSTNGGQTWQPMKTIMDMGEPQDQNGIGDPSVLVDKQTGTIWAAAYWSHGNRGWNGSGKGLTPEQTGQLMLVKSDDDGITWSKPENITAKVKNPSWKMFFQGPGNGITMKNGTIVFPAQFRDSTGLPHSTIIYSSDHGKNWKVGTGAKDNTTESQIVELENGFLMINMRDNRGGSRSVAVTTDMGNTWTEHKTSRSALREPVCMASFIRVFNSAHGKRNSLLAFSNPDSKINRDSLTVKFSNDEGNSWNKLSPILVDEREGFGYSCLTKINDNYLGLLYEGSGELYFIKIKIPKFKYEKISN